MEMLLTILLWSVLVFAVSCVAFAKAAPEAKRIEARPQIEPALDAPRFFADDAARPPAMAQLPVEVLVSQIEHHVRLEQAAVESFLSAPTTQSLHSKTPSPLVN